MVGPRGPTKNRRRLVKRKRVRRRRPYLNPGPLPRVAGDGIVRRPDRPPPALRGPPTPRPRIRGPIAPHQLRPGPYPGLGAPDLPPPGGERGPAPCVCVPGRGQPPHCAGEPVFPPERLQVGKICEY